MDNSSAAARSVGIERMGAKVPTGGNCSARRCVRGLCGKGALYTAGPVVAPQLASLIAWLGCVLVVVDRIEKLRQRSTPPNKLRRAHRKSRNAWKLPVLKQWLWLRVALVTNPPMPRPSQSL